MGAKHGHYYVQYLIVVFNSPCEFHYCVHLLDSISNFLPDQSNVMIVITTRNKTQQLFSAEGTLWKGVAWEALAPPPPALQL